MTDLKSLAYELLHEAQQALQQDDNLTPTAVVITPTENLIFDLEYENDEEREELYAEMIEVALENNATAILTVNDIYLDTTGAAVKLEGPAWGELVETPTEALMVMVSGGGFDTWTLTSPYVHK